MQNHTLSEKEQRAHVRGSLEKVALAVFLALPSYAEAIPPYDLILKWSVSDTANNVDRVMDVRLPG